jgi:hypothetical protein
MAISERRITLGVHATVSTVLRKLGTELRKYGDETRRWEGAGRVLSPEQI